MNKLVFAATLGLPSIALAHPGHAHVGMSPYHHLVDIALVAAAVVGGYFLTRLAKAKLSRSKR